MTRLLAISGSLRARSSNTAVVRAIALIAPDGVEVDVCEQIGELPHFNPDVEESNDLPPAVVEFRARVGAADAIMICSPEYAHGVPGSMKNALDWLVGGPEIIGKTIALINAAPHATIAQAQLAETLRTMSTRVSTITLPMSGRRLDAEAIAADEELAAMLRAAIAALFPKS